MENDDYVKNSAIEGERLTGRSHLPETPGKNGFIGSTLDTIVSVFERVAAAKSDRIAIVCGEVRWTYGELNAKSNQLAEQLRGLGVRTDSFVAIYMDRSPEMLVAILGILKAGGAYLPIDYGYPATRVLEMLEDAKPVAILTAATPAPELSEKFSALSVSVVEMDSIGALAESSWLKDSPRACDGEDLAYLMYTSGSTGKPECASSFGADRRVVSLWGGRRLDDVSLHRI
jgi:non-ribosomal peptide synthetase component F